MEKNDEKETSKEFEGENNKKEKKPLTKNLLKLFKSFNNMKYIFSCLNENKKLDLIIYNKEFQKKFGINTEYYKKVSGKYIIGNKNGIGKEYELNTNILLYEGKFKNKKRSGEGKEYNKNGKIIFEGEYLNGKKWKGKGKEYFENGDLKFEGEYNNGEKNGKGKEYFDFEELLSLYEYLDSRK